MNKHAETLDLSICAEEQIHIPGSIQPHGVLLAVNESDMRVVQASASVEAHFGISHTELLGKSIDVLIGESHMKELTKALVGKDLSALNPYRIGTLSHSNQKQFDAAFHRVEDLLIVELEPSEAGLPISESKFFRTGYDAIFESLNCVTKSELLNSLAKFARVLTGFDRSMVYLFDSEWNGCVVAESRARENVESYLGMSFPASDIPAQARALYAANRLRLLVDVNAKPSPIYRDASVDTDKPLDLSKSILRSMSPIHIEYLKNMRAAASMSISFIGSNGELRGLIACHHSAPMYVNYQNRAACDFLSQLGSLKLSNLEVQEAKQRASVLQESRQELLLRLSEQGDLANGLISAFDALLDVAGATGAAVISGNRCLVAGLTPDRDQIMVLVDFLKKNAKGSVFSTDCLSNLFAEAAKYKSTASGLLATKIEIEKGDNHWLLWFKQEQIRDLRWAGNPDKSVEVDDAMGIQPRKSFALWKQKVSGKSSPWSVPEIDSVNQLRLPILEKALNIAEHARG
jgi:two-component system, chemotaxis family, sensor kinase Cph1